MTPGVSLESMRWWHIADCAALDRALFGPTAWSEESFWGELAGVPSAVASAHAPQRHYLVALREADRVGEEPVVVGYAGLAALAPEADVQTIGVAEDAQGLGIGGALLDALLARAGELDCRTVMLEVAADNDRALGLYTRRGFEQVAVRRDYYGPGRDARILRWQGAA